MVFAPITSTNGRKPLAQHLNRLVEYANSVYSAMQDYVARTVKAGGLHYDFPSEITREESKLLPKGESGIEAMAFFFFKLAIEDDRRYGVERIEHFHDFSEFLPITQK